MKNKKKTGISFKLLAIVILSITLVGFSMARYRNKENIGATATTAKWLFDVYINNDKITGSDNIYEIQLADTMDNPDTTLETGYIAPGSHRKIHSIN